MGNNNRGSFQKHSYPELSNEDKYRIVLEKLQKSDYWRKYNDLELLAKRLSSVESLKESYLSPEFATTVKLVEEQNKQNKSLKTKESFFDFSSKEESRDEPSNLEKKFLKSSNDKEEEDFQEYISSDDLSISKWEHKTLEKEIKIKLVITEIANTKSKKLQKKCFGPVLKTLKLTPELGLFHTALIIGPWMIGWNDSAICCPRTATSSYSFVTADLEVLTTVTDVKTTLDIIANCIVDYNCYHQYEGITFGKKNTSNCQDFIEDLLYQLNIKLNFDGPLGNYLSRIKKTGSSEMIFEPNEDFIEKFLLKEKIYKFSIHQDLDLFVRNLFEIDNKFDRHFKFEYALLKNFDRALWLRHLGDSNLLDYKCYSIDPDDTSDLDKLLNLDNGTGCGCPFSDPRETNSIMQAKSFKGIKLL
eukprot:gene10837-3457_t